jgi:hypothetical protein
VKQSKGLLKKQIVGFYFIKTLDEEMKENTHKIKICKVNFLHISMPNIPFT